MYLVRCHDVVKWVRPNIVVYLLYLFYSFNNGLMIQDGHGHLYDDPDEHEKDDHSEQEYDSDDKSLALHNNNDSDDDDHHKNTPQKTKTTAAVINGILANSLVCNQPKTTEMIIMGMNTFTLE